MVLQQFLQGAGANVYRMIEVTFAQMCQHDDFAAYSGYVVLRHVVPRMNNCIAQVYAAWRFSSGYRMRGITQKVGSPRRGYSLLHWIPACAGMTEKGPLFRVERSGDLKSIFNRVGPHCATHFNRL
jgi:hypothetical protein